MAAPLAAQRRKPRLPRGGLIMKLPLQYLNEFGIHGAVVSQGFVLQPSLDFNRQPDPESRFASRHSQVPFDHGVALVRPCGSTEMSCGQAHGEAWVVMARGEPIIRIRLPEALKERLQTDAEGNRRSMNAEIVARLEWIYSAEQSAVAPADWLNRLQRSSHIHAEKRFVGMEARLEMIIEELVQRVSELENKINIKK